MNSGIGNLALSIAMIAVLLLGAGGMWLIVRQGEKKRGILMLAAALVILGNVLIWTVPMGQGATPAEAGASEK